MPQSLIDLLPFEAAFLNKTGQNAGLGKGDRLTTKGIREKHPTLFERLEPLMAAVEENDEPPTPAETEEDMDIEQDAPESNCGDIDEEEDHAMV